MVDATKKTQKAFCRVSPTEYQVTEIPIPKPGKGQVLIKVECAPINPSDTYFLRGLYDIAVKKADGKVEFPLAAGWEGSGTVIENGGGLMGWRLVGKRVAFTKQSEKQGFYTVGGAY